MSTTAVPTVMAPGAVRGMRRYLRSPQLRLGCALLVVAVAVAVLGPFLTPFDPSVSIGPAYAPPGSDGMALGGDQIGRDVLSRVLAGGVHLLWMAPLAALSSVAAGAALGLTAAFHGGIADVLLMRLMDVVLAFPTIVFALLFVSIIGPQPWLLVLLVAVALTPGVARVVRGTALPLMSREYVQWGRAVGLSSSRLLWREILPNVTSPLAVELGVRLMIAINILASLSFLGYGIQPPAPDWGVMVSENRNGLSSQPLSVFAPIVLIVLFAAGGNLIAEGIARVMARSEGKDER